MDQQSFQEMVQFALEKEKEAVEFYNECADTSTRPGMKQAFQEMAKEEEHHVKMLENFTPKKVESLRIKDMPNLKISDYLVDMEFTPNMKYQDLLILAMKREDAANALYNNLSTQSSDESIVKLFQILAQEELMHKNRLEKEYDEVVLKNN